MSKVYSFHMVSLKAGARGADFNGTYTGCSSPGRC